MATRRQPQEGQEVRSAQVRDKRGERGLQKLPQEPEQLGLALCRLILEGPTKGLPGSGVKSWPPSFPPIHLVIRLFTSH